jgi:hypothetical protein
MSMSTPTEAMIERSWPRALELNSYQLSIVRIASSGSGYRGSDRDAGP